MEELEWVSLIMDDSLSEFPPSCSGVVPPFPPPLPKPQTVPPPENRPAPLLSPTVCALSTDALVPVKAKRTKRSRSAGAGWSLSGLPPFTDSSTSSTTTTTTSSTSSCSSSSSSFESYLIYDSTGAGLYNLLDDNPLPPPAPPSKKQKTKKRGRKPKPPQASSAAAGGGYERRCSHCGVQKTPQWRAGPLGAKTLCNACGVRYKSGRLLPEYRPACSPTFITDVHSNSHRKVLEMRRKKEADLLASAAPPVPSF